MERYLGQSEVGELGRLATKWNRTANEGRIKLSAYYSRGNAGGARVEEEEEEGKKKMVAKTE